MKKLLVILIMLSAVVLLGLFSINFIIFKNKKYSTPPNPPLILTPELPTTTPQNTPATPLTLPARSWMETAETIVKKNNLPPTTAARFYAYVATAYFEALQGSNDPAVADEATRQIFQQIFPTEFVKKNTTPSTSTIVTNSTTTEVVANEWLKQLLDREKTDGFYTLTWNGKIPTQQSAWKSISTKSFLTPRAGDWKRWIISTDLSTQITPPPKPQSDKFAIELQSVEEAFEQQTTEQKQLLQSWFNGTSSITLSGKWQDILWSNFKQQKTTSNQATLDLKYAYLQKILAQALADSIMESWRAKFSYWAEPPFMAMPSTVVSTTLPLTPSYPSATASVNQTAAEILGFFFPLEKNNLKELVTTLHQAELSSAKQFPLDIQVGSSLGTTIGKEVIKHIGPIE
jgi:hypothetical protein